MKERLSSHYNNSKKYEVVLSAQHKAVKSVVTNTLTYVSLGLQHI